MEQSDSVRDGMLGFYERFSSGDADAFASGIADVPGVSVIGSGPDEGHEGRDEWVGVYREGIAELGMKLEGGDPVGYEEGSLGFGTDTPSFVLRDGGRLSTRLTAVLRAGDDGWQVVHLHFSVGVPDEEAIERA